MEDAITKALRKLIREELNAMHTPPTLPAPSLPHPQVEMPLRPGEVERHYPVREVARLLGMSRDWVYERINDGTFRVANFGSGKSKRRIPASTINEFIRARTYN